MNQWVLLIHQHATATAHLFVVRCISARTFSKRLSFGLVVQLTQACDGPTSCLQHRTKTEAHVSSCPCTLHIFTLSVTDMMMMCFFRQPLLAVFICSSVMPLFPPLIVLIITVGCIALHLKSFYFTCMWKSSCSLSDMTCMCMVVYVRLLLEWPALGSL